MPRPRWNLVYYKILICRPPAPYFPRFLQEFVSGISVLIRGSLVDKLECEFNMCEDE